MEWWMKIGLSVLFGWLMYIHTRLIKIHIATRQKAGKKQLAADDALITFFFNFWLMLVFMVMLVFFAGYAGVDALLIALGSTGLLHIGEWVYKHRIAS